MEIGLVVQCEEDEEDLPTHYPIFNGYKHYKFHVYQFTEELIHERFFSKSNFTTAIGNQLSSLACLIESGNTITEWDLKYFHLFGIRKLLGAALCSPSLTALATADSYTHSTQGRKHSTLEVMSYKHRWNMNTITVQWEFQ